MKEFQPGSPSGNAVVDWWEQLKKNPGSRANLRRCNTPVETVFIPTSHILKSYLEKIIQKDNFNLSSDRICAIAGILSHIRENQSTPFAKQMAGSLKDKHSPISDMRFRRLLQFSSITKDELFYQRMIRVIHHLERKVDVLDVFGSLYFWGDATKKRWAYDYYGSSQPSDDSEDQEQ